MSAYSSDRSQHSVSIGFPASEQALQRKVTAAFIFLSSFVLFQFSSQTCLVCARLFSGEIEQNYGNFSLSTMNGDISLLEGKIVQEMLSTIFHFPLIVTATFSQDILTLKTIACLGKESLLMTDNAEF